MASVSPPTHLSCAQLFAGCQAGNTDQGGDLAGFDKDCCLLALVFVKLKNDSANENRLHCADPDYKSEWKVPHIPTSCEV